ncbi:MAG: acyltransferase [Lactobacillaceae bacterium]|jgi:fucose 4-O-acetylase-like acetyltransferase|nr:acyltransferase [Lactobacillaceae bacterium]
MERARVEWVDVAKGIAILLVVYGHVILGLNDATLWDTPNYHFQYSVVYGFHMPLFFLLSGLFINNWVNRPFKQAISQKAYRLLIPYVVWSLIQGSVMILLSGSTNSHNGWGLLAQIPTTPFSQFWYLYDLFVLFIVYYGLRRGIKLSDKWILLLALIIAPFAPYMALWQLFRIGYYLFFFVLGMFVWQHKAMLSKIPLSMATLGFIGVNVLYFHIRLPQFPRSVVGILVALVGIVFVLALSNKLHSKWLALIGRLSLPIYLMHILATAGTRILLMKLGMINVELQLLSGMLAGVLLPLLAYWLWQRVTIVWHNRRIVEH